MSVYNISERRYEALGYRLPHLFSYYKRDSRAVNVDTLHDRMRVNEYLLPERFGPRFAKWQPSIAKGEYKLSFLSTPNATYELFVSGLMLHCCLGDVWSETEQGENENEHVPPQPQPPRIMRHPIVPYTFKNPYCFYQLNATSRDTNKIKKPMHCYTILVVNDEIRISNPSCISDNTVNVDLIRSAG